MRCSCGELLVDGVLRCRYCGAPGSEAERGTGTATGFDLNDIAPEATRAVDLVDELAQLAPETASWWRQADRAGKRRLLAILEELHRLIGI